MVIELSGIQVPKQCGSIFSEWDDDACIELEGGCAVVRGEVDALAIFVGESIGDFCMCEVSYVIVRSFNSCEARAKLRKG